MRCVGDDGGNLYGDVVVGDAQGVDVGRGKAQYQQVCVNRVKRNTRHPTVLYCGHRDCRRRLLRQGLGLKHRLMETGHQTNENSRKDLMYPLGSLAVMLRLALMV